MIHVLDSVSIHHVFVIPRLLGASGVEVGRGTGEAETAAWGGGGSWTFRHPVGYTASADFGRLVAVEECNGWSTVEPGGNPPRLRCGGGAAAAAVECGGGQ